MKCDVSFELLNGYLDGELSEEQKKKLDAHIATCPQCQQELAELRALDTRVREREIPEPSREFIFRVNRHVMERIRKPRRFSLFKFAPVLTPLAVAALIMIIVINAPQPERLISVDDQIMYHERDISFVEGDKKDFDLEIPELPKREKEVFYRDEPAGGVVAKKAAPVMPSEPVVSKSGERTVVTNGEEYTADDRCEQVVSYGKMDELEVPSSQIVRAIVDTSGNIVKVATGNTLIPETDTVLENCLKGRQVQVPMVGGRRTQMYIDFTQEAEEDTGRQ